MDNLPMKRKINLFTRIKMFFEKIFVSKVETKENDYQKSYIERKTEKQNFEDNLKIIGTENTALVKIEMQNRKNKLLEQIAENPELLNDLSMEELTVIEDMYDEEIEKLLKSSQAY